MTCESIKPKDKIKHASECPACLRDLAAQIAKDIADKANDDIELKFREVCSGLGLHSITLQAWVYQSLGGFYMGSMLKALQIIGVPSEMIEDAFDNCIKMAERVADKAVLKDMREH